MALTTVIQYGQPHTMHYYPALYDPIQETVGLLDEA